MSARGRRLFGKLKALCRGVSLLCYPEVIKILGELRLQRMQLDEIRRLYPEAKFSRDLEITAYEPDRLKVGPGSTVCRGTILAFGDDANGYGRIRVGAKTWIGQYNNLRACGKGDIVIGDNCLVSQFCTLVGSNHKLERNVLIREQGPDRSRLGVSLGNDVWLGAGVVVMPGVSVGNGAVVGANSVVTKDILEYEIQAGCPARKIGIRETVKYQLTE